MERHYTSGTRRKTAEKSKSELRDQWRAVRLIICLAVFAAMLCLKTFAPQTMERIRYKGLEIIGGSVDYKAAFRTVGQMIAGEKPVKEAMAEAYEYAFSVSKEEEAVEADAPADEPEEAPEEESEPAVEEQTPRVESLTSAEAEPDSEGNLPFPCAAPVIGTLTSPFGYRTHPVDGVVRFHSGVDLGADQGTRITAFADGTVYAVGESATLGKYVTIDHPDGVRTVYGHCSEIHVADGDTVKLGQHIADVGSTGNATGNCLHFEIYVDGSAVDPQRYFTCA